MTFTISNLQLESHHDHDLFGYVPLCAACDTAAPAWPGIVTPVGLLWLDSISSWLVADALQHVASFSPHVPHSTACTEA